jgi:hypothetical protein
MMTGVLLEGRTAGDGQNGHAPDMPGRDMPQTAAGGLALDRDPPRFRRLRCGQVQL